MELTGVLRDGGGAKFMVPKSPPDAELDHAVMIEMGLDTDGIISSDHLGREVGEDRMRRVNYANTLSARQMSSLVALCDTFLPAVDPPSHDESVAEFYRTSASMIGTPEAVGGLISERLKHPSLWQLKMALWALSTWIGTFFMCGRRSITSSFPYFHSFPELPHRRREEILIAWTVSYIRILRVLAKSVKFLVFLVYFTQVNGKAENPSWKAIGYCGPDPEFKNRTSKPKGSSRWEPELEPEQADSSEGMLGPLHRGLVDMTHSRDIVADTLRRSGFPVSVCPLEYNAPDLCLPSLSIRCDAVVVGSGSGGGVIAGMLAKAGYKVLVLEKGSYRARSSLSLLEGPTIDEMYLSGGLLASNDMSTLILAGSTVGGGSTINWSASIRTPRYVLDEWSDRHDLELFSSKLYREAMDVVCKRMGVQPDVDVDGFNNAVLRKGCQELGYPVMNIPRNSAPDHYCGWCCLGCKDGRKKGTAETWLLDLIDSGNGLILPGCEAVQVMHDTGKGRKTSRTTARGVLFEFESNGSKETCIIESKVTIVACGALSTPALLRKSGLRNPNIGRNLHVHPVAMAWGYFPDTGSPDQWPETEKKSYTGGIMTAMSTVVANVDRSGYGAVIQTPALHPGMFSVLIPWVNGTDIKDCMRKFDRTAHVFALARDRGSGTAMSPDSVAYKLDAGDELSLQRGLEKVLRILAAAGAEEIGTHNSSGRTLNVKTASSHEFERFVKEESSKPLRDLSAPICSAHQMGSCRMGTDPKVSAVNPMGETWDVEGLYVADTSVFPTALGVNPMVTVQSIAYCTAQSVLEALRRKKDRPFA